jgi:2-polyprenyl-6-methoxyphenol hydroxylase-like FAD-dependent oxidoreductase
MPKTYDVLINGGGPVGMGLAIELGQRGHSVCVVERYPEPQPIPKGQNLTQRTAEHFLAWGCEAVLRTAHPIPEGGGIGGMTTYGTLLSDYHYDWLNRAHVGDYYFAKNARLPQYATERVLRARASEIDCIDVMYGWSGEALEEHDDGVTLTVAEHHGDARKVLQGAFVVGCDGSRSFVREAAGITETRSEHNRLMALLVFRSEELHELLKRYPGKAFYNVLHPDFDGYWQFFGRVDHGLSWFFHAPVPKGTTTENHDFRAMLYRAVGQEFALEFDHIGMWDLRVSIADNYRRGRAFIAGDAAHSHPPYGGYGINTGFEDARNLGWKLSASLEGWAGQHLLDSYDAERRPVFVSTARDFIERYIEEDREFLNSHDPARDRDDFERAWAARNLGGDEVDAFEPNYAGSPVIGGAGKPSAKGRHTFAARRGHLLPPPGKAAGSDVLERLGKNFTLLTTADQAARTHRDVAERLGVPLKVAQLTETEAQAYETDMLLVRPDRIIVHTGDADAEDALARAIGAT